MNTEEALREFRKSYLEALRKNGFSQERGEALVNTLKELVEQEICSPYKFELFHEALRAPFDYYAFGNDFFRPLIKLKESQILGREQLEKIVEQLAAGENVVLFANHQVEPDPQVISILLEEEFPELVEKMIFVAGSRVVSDPLAIPFSKGRNLLCIHSKRHIDHPPHLKEEKILHNKKTLEKMRELLLKGGKCIYVAPSGGRDRPDAEGHFFPAPMDPSSLELFHLMARGTQTHFYPFAMKTYKLLPPPDTVKTELGEERQADSVPVGIAFGPEVFKESFEAEGESKEEKRAAWANYVGRRVLKEYKRLRSTRNYD